MKKVKVVSPTVPEMKRILKQRLEGAKKGREKYQPQWEANIRALEAADGMAHRHEAARAIIDVFNAPAEEVSAEDSAIGVNYIFRYTRFRHSQLSANPPSVIARPRSSDPRDRRKADAGDRLARWIRDEKRLQEQMDLVSLSTITTGTGMLRQGWDELLGDVVDFDESSGEVKLRGDSYLYAADINSIWLDPHAKHRDDLRYFFEEVVMPLEEAVLRWPAHTAALRDRATTRKAFSVKSWFMKEEPQDEEPVVKIMRYFERGLPVNGMAGRYCVFLEDGDMDLLEGPAANPAPGHKLPLYIFTDIDVKGQVYGDSPIKYAIPMQEVLNRMDSNTLDNIQIHNVVRFVAQGDINIETDAITNSAIDWVHAEGNGTIHPLQTPTLMPDAWRFREQYILALQDTFGINDAMMGIQRREQSAVSQQTSIEAGTMIHRRLFVKYQGVVQDIFRDHLDLIRKHWETKRKIYVLGKEKAFEALDIAGADIQEGFDIVVEYGTSLPIDPNMRREAILLMQPLLEKAGVDAKLIIKHLKLNELEALHDVTEMAGDRQREIFEKMIKSFFDEVPEYIPPKPMRDHAGMLSYAYAYFNSKEFDDLPEECQKMLEQHVAEREQLAPQQAVPQGGPAAAPQAAAPAPAMPEPLPADLGLV